MISFLDINCLWSWGYKLLASQELLSQNTLLYFFFVVGGVRFLYDNVVESINRFESSSGFGCILAHSMGLGKTLQLVTFCDIFLRYTPAKTVLCIMPINTLQNWMAEFNMWIPTEENAPNSPLNAHGVVRPRNFNLHVLNDSHKTLIARSKVIHEWHSKGGVLLIGYEQFRLLSLKKFPKSRRKLNATDAAADENKTKILFDRKYFDILYCTIYIYYVWCLDIYWFLLISGVVLTRQCREKNY